MKLARLPAMLKGLRRVLGANARAVRRGVAPAALKLGMDAILDRSVPAHANIRAALALALQGLLRSAEYACDSGVKFNPAKHLTRADIVECSAERLVVMMLPCKNMRHLTGKTCPLVIGSGGELVDAVAEVRNMMAVDPVSPLAAGSTPLLGGPQRTPKSRHEGRCPEPEDLFRPEAAPLGIASRQSIYTWRPPCCMCILKGLKRNFVGDSAVATNRRAPGAASKSDP